MAREVNKFASFDKKVDLKGLKGDIASASSNSGGTYVEVPHGTYEVAIDKLELTVSKNGNPMVSCWFKVLEGDYKNQLIFMNQVVTEGFQIHIADEFLRSLETSLVVEFESYTQYADLLMDIFEEIRAEKYEYALEYSSNKKGYNTFRIVDVY